MSGAVPWGWRTYLLDADEFLSLSRRGLTSTVLDGELRKHYEGLEAADVAKTALVALGDESGFPSINVQPCFPGAPVGLAENGVELAEQLGRAAGVTIHFADSVEIGQRRFALLKLELSPQFDVYEAFVGDESCVSVIALGTVLGDRRSLPDFKMFLALLRVEEGQIRLPEK
jgi:hypothetical protein